MLGYLSLDIIRSLKLTVFLELRGQISEHIFAPNEGYCLYMKKIKAEVDTT